MQEARAELQTGGDAFLVANRDAQLLQRADVRLAAIDIGEEGKIVAVMDAAEMRAEPALKRRIGAGLAQGARIALVGVERDAVLLEDRRFRAERAGFLIGVGQLARCDLARFDVRLVERIDADDRSGDRGCDLEAEEFLGEHVRRRQG